MDKINKIKEIKNAICSYYNIAECEVDSRSRKAEIVKVRHLILYMTRYEMGITFREIGNILHKEVSTVVRNFQSISNSVLHDRVLQIEINELKTAIREKINEVV